MELDAAWESVNWLLDAMWDAWVIKGRAPALTLPANKKINYWISKHVDRSSSEEVYPKFAMALALGRVRRFSTCAGR